MDYCWHSTDISFPCLWPCPCPSPRSARDQPLSGPESTRRPSSSSRPGLLLLDISEENPNPQSAFINVAISHHGKLYLQVVSAALPSSSIAPCFKLTRMSREHPEASEVFVTGTFDDWGKTEKLDRKGDFFEKDVQLPNKDKILYKVSPHRFCIFISMSWELVASSTSQARNWKFITELLPAGLSSSWLTFHPQRQCAHQRFPAKRFRTTKRQWMLCFDYC